MQVTLACIFSDALNMLFAFFMLSAIWLLEKKSFEMNIDIDIIQY